MALKSQLKPFYDSVIISTIKTFYNLFNPIYLFLLVKHFKCN